MVSIGKIKDACDIRCKLDSQFKEPFVLLPLIGFT